METVVLSGDGKRALLGDHIQQQERRGFRVKTLDQVCGARPEDRSRICISVKPHHGPAFQHLQHRNLIIWSRGYVSSWCCRVGPMQSRVIAVGRRRVNSILTPRAGLVNNSVGAA